MSRVLSYKRQKKKFISIQPLIFAQRSIRTQNGVQNQVCNKSLYRGLGLSHRNERGETRKQ